MTQTMTAETAPDPEDIDMRLATSAWLSVVQTYNQCTATLTARMAPLGLSLLQYEILMNLLRSPGMTQQELANKLFSAKSGISMHIAGFEKQGIIRRLSDPADARVRRLELTDEGQVLAAKVRDVQDEVVRGMMGAYPAEELQVLKERMAHMMTILKDMRGALRE